VTFPSFVLGSPEWLTVTLAVLGVAVVLVAWSYTRTGSRRGVRVCCATLKLLGFVALGLCLVEPLLTGLKPRPGANHFLVVADNSQSLQLRNSEAGPTLGEWARGLLKEDADWRARLGEEFNVRCYTFDTHPHAVDHFEDLTFDGTRTSLVPTLASLAKRYEGLPVAGILLVSDGNGTVPADIDWSSLPPVYPVLPPAAPPASDLGVQRVTLSQTNFEAAPVVLQAAVAARGFKGRSVAAVVTDEDGKEVERQTATPSGDSDTLGFRFQLRPTRPGVSFYRVSATPAKEGPPEQTEANNSRLVVVDRGGGPYRVLYVSGRPNWEFKYLRRALDEDTEVQLIGLIRMARRKPKFDFGDIRASKDNPFYKGFDNPNADTAERRDQPVLLRLGTRDEAELRDGFPKTAKDLYAYHAVILDDLEARFFTQDQLTLLRNFVSQRGGGLLMLGGPNSFAEGHYDRTPVGDALPVYLDGPVGRASDQEYRLVLTREGWLQPWVRTRKTEDEERKRLNVMSSFLTVNGVGNVKPGAAVLSRVRDTSGRSHPALVAQPYGKGRSAALLVGDLWRWGLRKQQAKDDDFERSWRQTVRWLVANVPGRVEIEVRPQEGSATSAVDCVARVVGPEYLPLDNADVTFRIVGPDKEEMKLAAEPHEQEPGVYVARYVPKQPGAYRVAATVTAADGSAVGVREAGWTSQPEADEFARVVPNRAFLESIAARTGGEVVDGEKLDSFVAGLSSRKAPITETWVYPLWHHAFYFLITIFCLAAEWGLRRTNGLA
jgi:uncharacterized membrane protein